MMIVRRRLASAVNGWEDSLGGMASVFEVYVSCVRLSKPVSQLAQEERGCDGEIEL